MKKNLLLLAVSCLTLVSQSQIVYGEESSAEETTVEASSSNTANQEESGSVRQAEEVPTSLDEGLNFITKNRQDATGFITIANLRYNNTHVLLDVNFIGTEYYADYLGDSFYKFFNNNFVIFYESNQYPFIQVYQSEITDEQEIDETLLQEKLSVEINKIPTELLESDYDIVNLKTVTPEYEANRDYTFTIPFKLAKPISESDQLTIIVPGNDPVNVQLQGEDAVY